MMGIPPQCPDFTSLSTGVGRLPVSSGMAAQLHILYHNGLRCSRGLDSSATEPSRAPITPSPIQRDHPPAEKASPDPLPPPSGSYPDLIKQWERLLTWATLKTLQDFKVMPTRPAREVSQRLAKRILDDYGPSLHKWLCRPQRKSPTSGAKTP